MSQRRMTEDLLPPLAQYPRIHFISISFSFILAFHVMQAFKSLCRLRRHLPLLKGEFYYGG